MNIFSQKKSQIGGVITLLGLLLLYKFLHYSGEKTSYFLFFYLWPSVILVPSLIFDLWTKKIPNPLLLAFTGVSLILVGTTQGLGALPWALLKTLISFLFLLPIYILRIIGGGDVKLVLVLSIIMFLENLLYTVCVSFICGGILGLVKSVVDRKFYILLWNLRSILKREPYYRDNLNFFPFSVSLFLAWLVTMDM